MRYKNEKIVMDYVESVLSGKKLACVEIKQSCQRFRDALSDERFEYRPRDAEFVCQIIENTMVFDKGQDMDGNPLTNMPFKLQPFEKFHIFNLLGLFWAGTKRRRFTEAFIMVPRKNDKTRFSANLCFALGLLDRRSGSTIYITSAALKQSLESFNYLLYNLRHQGEYDKYRILDNNNEHSIYREFPDGHFKIVALAANPDSQDSFNCNYAIADELHAYKRAKQYNIIREAMKSYTNKLMVGITTAGDDMNSFGYRRLRYGQKVLSGAVTADELYVFIAKAPEGENGEVDYTNPEVHEMANPSYGVIIRPWEIMKDAVEAQNDPQQRKDFLAKSLNVYTAAMRAYFNLAEFQDSNDAAEEVLEIDPMWPIEKKVAHLSKLPIRWFGGTDLSKMHDLTAAALYGEYKDIDIVIPHAWFPIVEATAKAEEDSIPLFGWQDDGWLTMSNAPTVNYAEVVNWYGQMKARGFNIKQVGHDRRFAKEYILMMKEAGFQISDQRQYDWVKVQGFRRIESKAKNKQFYYLGAEPFEYCLANVRSVENLQEKMRYEKVDETSRIDVFDAAVMAACQLMEQKEVSERIKRWL